MKNNKTVGRILKSSKSTKGNTLYVLKIRNKYIRSFDDDKYDLTHFEDMAFTFGFKHNAIHLKERINNKQIDLSKLK